MKRFSCLALVVAAICLAAAPVARASVVFVAPTASTTGSMTITAPISFTLTASLSPSAGFNFIFQNWVVTSDGVPTGSSFTPNLALTINGSAAIYGSGSGSFLADNAANAIGSVGPNDGYIYTVGITNGAATGSIVTLAAGTYALSAASGFNPLTTQTFAGNMFIAASSGARVSDIVSAGAVPEPTTWALALGGASLLGFVARRRRGAL